MARFYGTVQGRRGEASRLGDGKSGMRTTCRGWSLGAVCEMESAQREGDGHDIDKLSVTINEGSGRKARDYGGFTVTLVGESAIITPDGTFLANVSPLILAARIDSAFGSRDAHWANLAERICKNPVAAKHLKAALFIEGRLSE
jgi:hypothetical protein